MSLDFTTLSPEELVAAESAALTMRALIEAVKTAPHGHGMASVESVIQDKGMSHLRTLLTTAITSHAEAQKKMECAAAAAPAERTPRSSGARERRS